MFKFVVMSPDKFETRSIETSGLDSSQAVERMIGATEMMFFLAKGNIDPKQPPAYVAVIPEGCSLVIE